MLQDDGLADASSMSMDELDPPALNGTKSRRRGDQPASGGGVDRGVAIEGAQEQPDPAAALGGKLETPCFDPRKLADLCDRGGNPLAAHAFGDGPGLVLLGLGVKQEELFQRDSCCRDGGGVERLKRVAPDDHT